MTASRLGLPGAWLVLACTLAPALAFADNPPSPRPADAPPPPGLLTVTGRVVMPDGSPAAGAAVRSIAEPGEVAAEVRTDDAGRFRLRGLFGNGGRLHARSADGSLQVVRVVSALVARVAFASPQ